MDGNGRRRRQNEPPQYANPDERFAQGQDLGRNFSDESADRYRQPGSLAPPGSSSRGSASAIPNYGYYAEQAPPFPAASPVDQMAYQTEYAQESRQQPANFAAYAPNLTYGINQQPSGNIIYDDSQQFQERQSNPVQMLSDPNSFYSGEPMVGQVPPSMYAGPGSSIGMPHSLPDSATDAREIPSTIEQAYRRCNADLGQIFQHILDGSLVLASQLLMRFSEWLISHVEDMELTSDEAAREDARSKLWDDFNHAWLALMQKQKSSTEELLQAGISQQQPQLLASEDINKMCSEIVRLDDEYLERHGLVNYQYGVLEDQIINSAIKCLDLLENNESDSDGPQRPSATRQAPTSRPG